MKRTKNIIEKINGYRIIKKLKKLLNYSKNHYYEDKDKIEHAIKDKIGQLKKQRAEFTLYLVKIISLTAQLLVQILIGLHTLGFQY